MEYLALRNCVVDDVLWKEGRVYDLPDAMYKYEKNFSKVNHQGVTPEEVSEATESTTSPANGNNCSECGKECKNLAGLKAHERSHKEDG